MLGQIAGGLIGGIGGMFAGNRQAKAIERGNREALQFQREGREAFEGTPIVNTFMPGGANAFETRQALLGLGGDVGAAEGAFQNYLDSSGFNFALDTGMDAITGNRAARGILDSGRTGTNLMEFGSNLGRRAFDNYLGQLMQDTQVGLNANQTYGNVLTGSASNMSNIAQRGGEAVGSARGDALGNLVVGLGSAADAGISMGQKRGWF
jgi:hypothetical protein